MLLTTTEALAAELGTVAVDHTDLIGQWSAAIEAYCNRSFDLAEQTRTIRLDRWRERLVLDRTPVAAVGSVLLNGEELAAGAVEIESAGAGFLLRVDAAGGSLGWPAGRAVVTYTAGYAAPPPDVERCCIDLCVRAWHFRGRDPALRSESVDGVINRSWVDPDKVETRGGLPADIAGRLDAYRVLVL